MRMYFCIEGVNPILSLKDDYLIHFVMEKGYLIYSRLEYVYRHKEMLPRKRAH